VNFPCKCSECGAQCNSFSDLLTAVHECEREEFNCPLMAWLDHDDDDLPPSFPILGSDQCQSH
jgi:hypothetical protein